MNHKSRYEQAYYAEREKLEQNVVAYKELALDYERLKQGDRHYRELLLPYYSDIFCRQEQKLHELRSQIQSLEIRNAELEKRSLEVAEEHRSTVDVAEELLRTRSERIAELEGRATEVPVSDLLPVAPVSDLLPVARPLSSNSRKRLRASQPVGTLDVRTDCPPNRGQNCEQTKS